MKSLRQDLSYAARLLKKNLGFTAIAILTLALGIGANTAIFSVVNAVLLRPLDFYNPSSLYILSGENVKKGIFGTNLGYTHMESLRDRNTVFENFAVFSPDVFNLVGSDAPEQLQAVRVSSSFFDVLGIHPTVGRGFLKQEDRPGAAPVIVLGHDLWMHRFGGDYLPLDPIRPDAFFYKQLYAKISFRRDDKGRVDAILWNGDFVCAKIADLPLP